MSAPGRSQALIPEPFKGEGTPVSASLRPAVILDRDGVINRDRGYVHRTEDFELLPAVVPALRQLAAGGYVLAIVTNQSGLARGLYSLADYERLSRHMLTELAREGVAIDGIEYCPHLPDAAVSAFRVDCGCRKPAPGMILALAERLRLDLSRSVLVGDKLTDVLAGRAAAVGRCVLVRSGQRLSAADESAADAVYADLAAFAESLAPP